MKWKMSSKINNWTKVSLDWRRASLNTATGSIKKKNVIKCFFNIIHHFKDGALLNFSTTAGKDAYKIAWMEISELKWNILNFKNVLQK